MTADEPLFRMLMGDAPDPFQSLKHEIETEIRLKEKVERVKGGVPLSGRAKRTINTSKKAASLLRREEVGTDLLLLAMLDAGRGQSVKRPWRFLAESPWPVTLTLKHYNVTWDLVSQMVGPVGLTPQAFPVPEELAPKLMRQLQASVLSAQELVSVANYDFPLLDAEFYEQVAEQLGRLGFRFLADIENLSSSKVYPGQRHFVRYLVDDSETVLAAVREVASEMRRFQALQARRKYRSQKTLGFTSIIQPSRIVITTNSELGPFLRRPPEFDIGYVPPGTPMEEHLSIHRSRLEETSSSTLTRVTNPDQLLEFLRCQHSIEMQYRSSIDAILTREEMLNLYHFVPEKQIDEVYAEILRMRRSAV